MEYKELVTAATIILAVIGALIVIMNFVDKVRAWIKPSSERNQSVSERLKTHDDILAKDNKRISALETDSAMMLQTLLAIIDHEITGNSIENLKSTKEKLTKYLIER